MTVLMVTFTSGSSTGPLLTAAVASVAITQGRPPYRSRSSRLPSTALSERKLGLTCSRMGDSNFSKDSLISTVFSDAEQASLRRELHPPIEPYSTGELKVSEIHTLYWEQSGNPEGYPVLFLHGGPGGGTSSSNRRFFDPSFYRIVLLDQRGAGKSTPHACLEENTTWHLVEDIEKLRKHLNIEEWLIFGGSWGSTLSLAYAQLHPEHVTGIILRGIFLTRKKEIDWFYEGGAAALFPDAWEDYRDFIPEEERGDFVAAYSKRLKSNDPTIELRASKAWTKWEMATLFLLPNEESLKRSKDDNFSLHPQAHLKLLVLSPGSTVCCITIRCFASQLLFTFCTFQQTLLHVLNLLLTLAATPAEDSYLLDNVDKIRHIPAVIIQGRYDVVCPMMSAWDLHKAWPEAKLQVVPNAGHSADDPGITAELVAATESFKEYLKKK
ncbi:hypothetical protein L7F22_013081 [Adiantum nelumboides]|nr:hypothetical protein [Adiantum nelumboides]